MTARRRQRRLAQQLRETALRNLRRPWSTPSTITGMQPARVQVKPPVHRAGWRIWPPRHDRQGER